MPMFPLRIEDSLMTEVDTWMRKEGLEISRSEALRRLVRAGLTAMERKRSD
jgi:metal-responsive CopG/Arc/MetJ family transcriptional regulator